MNWTIVASIGQILFAIPFVFIGVLLWLVLWVPLHCMEYIINGQYPHEPNWITAEFIDWGKVWANWFFRVVKWYFQRVDADDVTSFIADLKEFLDKRKDEDK